MKINSRINFLKPFKAGTILNPLKSLSRIHSSPVYRKVNLTFPTRLNAMAMDPSRIAIKKNAKYTAGEVIFSVALFRKIRVSLRCEDANLVIIGNPSRQVLIKHAFLLMKKALEFSYGINIEVDISSDIPHAGLGSSSGLIAGVASAINELFGKPIESKYLLKYIAQNHGEEIEGDEDYLYPVQSLGGSVASGLYKAGLLLIAGENDVIASMTIPDIYSVVIGIPKNYIPKDAKTLMNLEIKNMHKFIRTGKRFGPQIAYQILHKMMPAIIEGDLKTIGDVIYEYRFRMGSIKNCSYAHKDLPKLMDSLAYLKTENLAEVLSISSVGPGVFAITRKTRTCLTAFQKAGLKTVVTKINNDGYQILDKKEI